MKTYVTLKEECHGRLVKRLLHEELRRTVTIVWGSVISVSMTLLSEGAKAVAILIDADTLNDTAARDQWKDLDWLMKSASNGTPYRIYLVVPEIDVLLFRAPGAVERIVGRAFTPDEAALAKYHPSLLLKQLDPDRPALIDRIVASFTDDDLDAIRAVLPVSDLLAFLADHVAPKPALVSA